MCVAAEWISWGLEKGSEKAGQLMKKGSTLIQEKVNPQEEPSKIDPRAQQGVYYARQATGAAVKVSGYISKLALHPDFYSLPVSVKVSL